MKPAARIIEVAKKTKKKLKVIFTLGTIAERAAKTLAMLDRQIATQASLRNSAYKGTVEQHRYFDLNTPKDVHVVTDQVCWRPDLYFKGGKFCDFCRLYPHCQAPCKRLKVIGSQKADVPIKAKVELIRKETPKKKMRFVFSK